MVHLPTIPITGTGINPTQSFGAAVIYNKNKAWDDQVCATYPSLFGSFCRENITTKRRQARWKGKGALMEEAGE
jgi:hypothetical protein